jgi:hypothetical protein
MADFCSYLRDRAGPKLSQFGFQEVACRRYGQDLSGHGKMYADQVAYYRRGGQLIGISYSYGNGVGCRVGNHGSDFADYRQWPTLWTELGMDAGFNLEHPSQSDWEKLGEWLDQMPEGFDANLDFVVAKLAELPAT